MRKSTLTLALAAALILLGTGCDTLVTLDRPTVTYEAIGDGGTLRLSWTAITDAVSYEITTDDSVYTTTSTSFDVTTPTSEIKVVAVNGNDESDPATIDCKVVETSSIVLYGLSDVDPSHPSGLAFTASGTASAMSLDDANKAALDFVCDDVNLTPVGLVNAGDYSWPQNAKLDAVLDAATTDFDGYTLAAARGSYITQLVIASNGVYALLLTASGTWSVNDHFAKAKIVSIEDVSGTQKVTLNVAYQKIGGLRWLMK
jgi:hypothetical protein